MITGNSLLYLKGDVERMEVTPIILLVIHHYTLSTIFLLDIDNAYRQSSSLFTTQLILNYRQFFILPPYQRQGHASELYNSIRSDVLSRQDVIELGVEDPSEAFDVLRDVNDLRWLNEMKLLENKTALNIDRQWIDQERKKLKVARRQFLRLIEMLLLHKLDPKNQEQLRRFRLLVSVLSTYLVYTLMVQYRSKIVFTVSIM